MQPYQVTLMPDSHRSPDFFLGRSFTVCLTFIEHGEGGVQSNLLPRKEPNASARDLLTPIHDRLFPGDRPRIPGIQLFQEIMLEFCSFEEEVGLHNFC